MTCVIPSQSHDISSFLMPVVQCIVAQWRHISSESAVALLLHLCFICSHILIFVVKCDAQSKAWDILLVLTSVAGNLCNKCLSGYSNKTAFKVILSMRSLVSIEQQSPRRPCDTISKFLSFTFLVHVCSGSSMCHFLCKSAWYHQSPPAATLRLHLQIIFRFYLFFPNILQIGIGGSHLVQKLRQMIGWFTSHLYEILDLQF